MRLWTVIPVALATLTACTNTDEPPPFIAMDYQVQCADSCNSAIDAPPREIMNLDGEDGFSVQCSVSDGALSASFECTDITDACAGQYKFQIIRADISGNGPGGDCLVVVKEGGSTYEGTCTANEPSVDTPCMVDLTRDGDAINGFIQCIDIGKVGAPTDTRSISQAGTDQPAPISVLNCL